MTVQSIKNSKEYYLHTANTPNGGKLYFFSGKPEGALTEIPEGYETSENPRTGLPILRKIKAAIAT